MRLAAFVFGTALVLLGATGFLITAEGNHPFHAWGMLVITFGGLLVLGVIYERLHGQGLTLRVANVRITGLRNQEQYDELLNQIRSVTKAGGGNDEQQAEIIRVATNAGFSAREVDPREDV